MRKHGWQLPYHPLQVVAVSVFLALGFAFYVFFAPFVGKKMFQHIVMGLYTPLVTSVFSLYIWCAAADPADPGVFKSKKYFRFLDNQKHTHSKDPKLAGRFTSSSGNHEKNSKGMDIPQAIQSKETEENDASSHYSSCFIDLMVCSPCVALSNCLRRHEKSSEQQMSEDGMFYCSLCEVEVFKYSKHCRVCDKCIDCFDHHCRWLNNCIGKRNYRQFFTLMVSALSLLVLQWSTGILVLICCFIDRKQFSVDITSKLGSSFSLVPFIIVVAMCTILAMIATLPLAQLFFFHILLIRKGISTYDYIIALREQDQQGVGGQQSPQMSPASSLTGISSASSLSTFHRGSWCTPPRLFLEDQFDVVPPDTVSIDSIGKKRVGEESSRSKNPATVKINPWTLARLNAEEVLRVAAEARKRSKVLQPVVRREGIPFELETESSFGRRSRRMVPRLKRGANHKQDFIPADLTKVSECYGNGPITETSTSLASLQLKACSAFRTSLAGINGLSPESSLGSPARRISSCGAEDSRQLEGSHDRIPFSRSNSDGYEASGGEDSDRVSLRIAERSREWSDLSTDQDEKNQPHLDNV